MVEIADDDDGEQQRSRDHGPQVLTMIIARWLALERSTTAQRPAHNTLTSPSEELQMGGGGHSSRCCGDPFWGGPPKELTCFGKMESIPPSSLRTPLPASIKCSGSSITRTTALNADD